MKQSFSRYRGASILQLKENGILIENIINPYGYNFGILKDYELDAKRTSCIYNK